MAHFAKINENNEVLTVLTVNNLDVVNSEGVETESVGQQYLETHNNWPANLWIQASYNTFQNQHLNGGTAFRGNAAAVGYLWDSVNQIFIAPKPYSSWVKDIATATWKSPIGDAPVLTEQQKAETLAQTHHWIYLWNEANQSWDLTNTLA